MDVELNDTTTGEKYTDIENPLTLSMKIPSNITDYSNLIIAHRKDSGEIEYITPTIKDGYAIFNLTSFSPIGLVTSVDASNPNAANETVAKTVESNAALPISLIVILSLGAIVFLRKKKLVD